MCATAAVGDGATLQPGVGGPVVRAAAAPGGEKRTELRATGLSYEAVSRPKKSILFAGRKFSGRIE